MLITQSFIKEIKDYNHTISPKYDVNTTCGLQIKAKYYDGIEFPPSEVQLLGQWFEFQATGQTTKYGHVPIAPTLKGGKLPKKYISMLVQVAMFKKMMEDYGFEIISTGTTIEHNGMKGDVDIIAKRLSDGKTVYIDIKTSGLMEDKWSEFGWDTSALMYKDRLMIQAVHYTLIGNGILGYYPDFYFLVFSNTNEIERKAIQVYIDPDRYAEHAKTVNNINLLRARYEQEGYQAVPTVKRCADCPLKENCESAIEIPEIEIVGY